MILLFLAKLVHNPAFEKSSHGLLAATGVAAVNMNSATLQSMLAIPVNRAFK